MTTAREIMHSGATCIGEDQSLMDAATMMRDMGVGALPICGNDQRLKGIITDRDIVIKAVAEGKDLGSCTAGELAQGHISYVEVDTDMDDIVEMMGREQVKRVPVIEGHRLVGMISEADLAQHLDDQHLSRFVEHVFAKR